MGHTRPFYLSQIPAKIVKCKFTMAEFEPWSCDVGSPCTLIPFITINYIDTTDANSLATWFKGRGFESHPRKNKLQKANIWPTFLKVHVPTVPVPERSVIPYLLLMNLNLLLLLNLMLYQNFFLKSLDGVLGTRTRGRQNARCRRIHWAMAAPLDVPMLRCHHILICWWT